jgi:hypothetical protein
MPRVLLLILLLAPACVRREVSTGEWTGVARPDAAAVSSPGGGRQEGAADLSKGVDAAPPPAPDTGAPGAFAAPDATTPPRTNDPVAPALDAGTDVGDARACPESGQCD